MGERKPAESRRREIADATLKVIAAHGPAGFTAQAIAGEVGMSDAGLFRHFATMEAMVDAAIDRVEEILFAGFPPEAADPIERLGLFFRQRAAVLRQRPGVARLVLCEELAQVAPPAGVARVREFRRRSVRFVRACVAEAHARGLLDEGLDPGAAAIVTVGALFALGHARGLVPAEGGADAPARAWSVLERLLRGPPRRAVPRAAHLPRRQGRRGRKPEERP
jgi:AcrR family transcriptional regulator